MSNRIEVPAIWREGETNPMQYLHNELKNIGQRGERAVIALGVSTKDSGDENRFNKDYVEPFEDYENLTVIPMPKEPHGNFSATNMRNAVTHYDETGDASMFQEYIPDGVSAEAVLNILSASVIVLKKKLPKASLSVIFTPLAVIA